MEINIDIKKENDRNYVILQQIPEDARKELNGQPIIGKFVNNDGWSFIPSRGFGFPFELHRKIHELFIELKDKGELDG